MGLRIKHKDNVVFVVVTSTGYGSNKTVIEQHDVKGTFLQDTGFLHSNNQESFDSDAVLYPDERNAFVIANHNRLEGMYVVAPLYGSAVDDSWYKVIKATVNRDHLLSNKIDNILLVLKKTEMLPGVS